MEKQRRHDPNGEYEMNLDQPDYFMNWRRHSGSGERAGTQPVIVWSSLPKEVEEELLETLPDGTIVIKGASEE